MVKQLNQRLAKDYPEILELNSLLDVAETTWKRWGISAIDLSEQSPYLIELLKILAQ